MNRFIFALFITLLFISQTNQGQILSGDLSVDYANAGYMTKLSLSFMLQNQILSTDYMKFSLPFPLHSQLVPAYPATQGLSLPSGLILTYQLMDSSTNLLPTVYYGQILTQRIDSSNYFIRFYATDRITFISIPANQWYSITFQIQDATALQYQQANSILQIQMATVSSVWPNAMVYDDNLAFNYFSLSATPSKSITITTTPVNFGTAGGYLLTQKSYSMNLDVTLNIPAYQFTQNLVLKFLISKASSFIWSGTCSSIAKTNAPTINVLNSSLYTCSIDPTLNVISVVLQPTALTLQTSFRFTTGIVNPPIIFTGVDIQVRAVQQNSGVIIANGISSSALKTNQIYVTYQQIFLGWGLRPDALLPFNARVFRGNSATPTYMPYNSLTLKFSISQSTSTSLQLKLSIAIPSQNGAFVLENGFNTNLPAAPNKVVNCVVEYASVGATRNIGCTGVGQLLVGTVYFVGWKMFFPYDNYQSSIDCTSFGTLTIFTTQKIGVQDNAFYLGRGNDYLTYLKSNPNFYVIGRNSSYITYMKTFLNLNLVVLSQDFQQFLKTPQQIFVTNRPSTFTAKSFNDVYVIVQNLAFMTYISLFQDIYIAAQLKSNTDIVKGYDTLPLVAPSTPKNTLTITTSNSQDWTDYVTDINPLVSSTSVAASNVPGTGLKTVSGSTQSLILGMKAPYASVTTTGAGSGTVATNNWGMMIMTNPLISFNPSSTFTLKQSSASLSSYSATTVSSASAYNQYTLVTLKGKTANQIQTSFPVTATKTYIGLGPFTISTFASIYANQNNMDIMIATVDGIDGPQNKMVYNGFFLINSFTMPSATLGTLNYGFMNYQSINPMDGSKVPTMLRVKGTVANNTNFDSLSIFFDSLTPFYSNYYTGDVFCSSSQNALTFCKFSRGYQTTPNVRNYQTLSRIDIPITSVSSAFNIYIPITFVTGQTNTNLYIGYQIKNSTTQQKAIYYIEPMRLITVSSVATSSGSFGPVLTTAKVGLALTPMVITANMPGGSITTNTANSIGGAFSYFSEWDYLQASAVTAGWTAYGTCMKMNYLYYNTNYASYLTGQTFAYNYKKMSGIVCPTDLSAGSMSSASVTVATGYLPSKWGKTPPGWGAYSQNTGHILYLKSNYQSITNDLSILTSVALPPAGPTMKKIVGEFVIPLQTSLDGNTYITIIGNLGTTNIPYQSTPSGTCGVFYNKARTPIGCTFASSPTQLAYTLIILEQNTLPAGGNFSIIHYGLTTNSTYNDITVDIKVYSLLINPSPVASDLIMQQLLVPWKWNTLPYNGVSQLSLSAFSQWTTNRATYQGFQFVWTLTNKGLYDTNRVRFDLGQFAVDNSASTLGPLCKVFTYDLANGSPQFSHDWSAVDTSQGLSKFQIWPSSHLISTSLTYLIRCSNFLSTSSPSPLPILSIIANTSADLTGQLTSPTPISPPMLSPASTSGQITLTKAYTIPSAQMEMSFAVVSPGITTDSFLYLNFPTYYSNGLGPDVKCYVNTEIYCAVKDRMLTARYLGNYAVGTTFVLTITGVARNINYNSGTFSFIFDNDNVPTTILSSGTFIDSVVSNAATVNNFPTFPVLSLTQSSSYLRQQGVTISANFYLPSTLTSISVGQSLLMVFPPIYFDVLRFITPTCTLNILGNTLKNYISSCSVKGMRIKMIFLDNIVLGTSYSLTVGGIINPTNPSSNVQKYSFQISSSDDSTIIAKTYSPNCNFVMPIFITNPIRTSLNYYTAANGLITNLLSTNNIQSENVYISASSDYVNSNYQRNTYLAPLNSLYTNPSNIQLSAGSNPFAIRFTSLTSGVNYVYFTKTGDGNFYSNLPPLILTTDKNYNTPVNFIQTSFKLPVNVMGTQYTISVSLPVNLYPMSQVNMTVTLSSAVGIALSVNPTVIILSPTKTSAYVTLYINDATAWTVSKTTNLIITPSDTTYSASVSIPLLAVSSSSSTPIITLTTSTTTKKSATFSIGCSEEGRIIYHVSRLFTYNNTACTMNITDIRSWSQQTSLDGLRVSETYYDCQDQIAVVNVVTKGTPQSIQINGLLASYAYTIQAFCQTQASSQSNLLSNSFSTVSNGGQVSQMSFYFASILTTSQKIKLVCALALYFNLDYQRVSTWDGYYCSELLNRRLLLQEVQMPRMMTASQYQTLVYFGVNNDLLVDGTQAAILTQSSLLNLKNELNTNVTGLPLLNSYSTSIISYVGSNQISNTNSTYRIDVGPTYVFAQGITLTNNGLIYYILGDSTLWPRDPTVSQIKKGSGPNGLPPAFFKIIAYKVLDVATGYMAMTGVAQGTYNLYILASDSNPFDTNYFGQIVKVQVQLETPKWEQGLVVSFVALLVILGFMF